MPETSRQNSESFLTYWRLAMVMSGDHETRFEAARKIAGISGAGEVPVSVLRQVDPSLMDLFCLIWDTRTHEEARERATDLLLGRTSLMPNQALALVPVAPASRRWEAVLRAVRLGVSFGELASAARSVRDQASIETLMHMICVAVTESSDYLFDWLEAGASMKDMVAVARSNVGRASVEAGDMALISGELSPQEVFDMTHDDFPKEVREMASFWLRGNAEPDDVFVSVEPAGP